MNPADPVPWKSESQAKELADELGLRAVAACSAAGLGILKELGNKGLGAL